MTAQGQAKAIETTFNAIHAAKPDPALLAYQYLQTLPQIAQGDANKMWIVPSEFSKALEGLAQLGGGQAGGAGGGDGPAQPSWLAQTSEAVAQAADLDTSDWFDSKIIPARDQPEAANLRASDEDPASQEAHTGLPPDETLPAPVAPAPPPPPAAGGGGEPD